MDLRLYWSGGAPEYLGPLFDALEALPETADAAEGDILFCPDAAALPAPDESADAVVAFVPNGEAAEALVGWAARGAFFITPTQSAAAALRVALGLPPERVRVVALPLPPARIPAAGTPGTDVLTIPPVNYSALLPAVKLTRLAGLDPRLLIADSAAEPLVRPGGIANAHGLLAHREVVLVEDWREATAGVGAIVLFGPPAGGGWLLREVLATGLPVVAPQSSLLDDHLAALGASLYPYTAAHDTPNLAATLTAALRRDRGAGIGPAAREAVMNESWADSAAALYRVLTDALAPAPAPASPGNGSIHAAVTGERLSVCVLNAKASEGGGERFMRELVHAMAVHESSPRLKLVAHVKPFEPFDPGTELLQSAGVEVTTVANGDFAHVAAREVEGFDVVYYSWPHTSDPLDTDVPLACTFHDLNWKHFDVHDAAAKAQLDAQTPRWVERSSALIHSSNFIREEMRRYYGTPDAVTHVIPLTAGEPPTPAGEEEREAVRRRFGLPERFLLSPAGFHLHKNYPVLDAALRILRREGRPVTVVATGQATDVRYHGPDLLGLGYVTARELQALFDECDGIVQTTLYEAGSWPMWEANIAGKPAAVSRIPSVVEQVERLGTVVELFDPLSPEELAGALARLWDGSPATDPQTLAANAAAVAARSWNDVASDYLGVFAELKREASNA